MNSLHHPDIERCKKLTEIGFPETELVFSDWEEDDYWNRYQTWDIILRGRWVPEPKPYFVCPSVMEMLDVIENWKRNKRNEEGEERINISDNEIGIYIRDSHCKCWEYCWGYKNISRKKDSDTLPNALADLIMWLHENNYIKF